MNALKTKISSSIEKLEDGDFERLILEIFDYQFRNNAPYQRLCVGSGITNESHVNWKDIPAVPAIAFKLFDLSCSPIENCSSVFYSSGTTSETASRHWMDSEALSLYEQSLSANFRTHFPEPSLLYAVMPSPESAPNSSLSHMLGTLAANAFVDDDLSSFGDIVESAADQAMPITVFGTAFGIAEMVSNRRFVLPTGSRVIETGGFKGRFREIERKEFYDIICDGFAVRDSQCYSEYGMCEMASQFYSNGVEGRLYGPNWVRTRCIDPLTNNDAPVGTQGLLRHYDLANLNSVAVIQTQDRAVMFDDDGFRLLGRATDAELRGCSLTAEELWSR